jgi:hypothetical protein
VKCLPGDPGELSLLFILDRGDVEGGQGGTLETETLHTRDKQCHHF